MSYLKSFLVLVLVVAPLGLLGLHYFGAVPTPLVEVTTQPPAQPQAGTPLPGNNQTVAATQPPPAPASGELGRLIEDLIYYQEGELIEGVIVFDERPPFQFQVPSSSLGEDENEELRKAAEAEINRPNGRGLTVESVTKVRYLLSQDGSRVVGALAFIQGKKADGSVLSEPGKEAACRLTFSSVLWSIEHSNTWSAQFLRELHDKHGEPDRGEIFERRILGVRTRLVQLSE